MSTYVSVVITGETAVRPNLSTYPARTPIGSVKVDDSTLSIQADSPADLRRVAQAFTDAAQQLADELDRDAARAMRAEQVLA